MTILKFKKRRKKGSLNAKNSSNTSDTQFPPSLIVKNFMGISEKYKVVDRNRKKLVLVITTGRSGVRWLCNIFRAHENANGGVERNATEEAFYRYIKWNKLPIDTTGIIELTKREILKDWECADISCTVSPYFSYDFLTIFEELRADSVIWAINDPIFTITSFYNKGWYKEENIRGNKNLVNGIQPGMRWSHIFGRLVPIGNFYNEWTSLTRIGKLAWFLNTINKEIYSNINKIPEDKIWIFKLEEADQNYEYYCRIAKKFGLRPLLNKNTFLSLKEKSSSPADNIPKIWSKKENEEFEKYCPDYIKIYNKI